MKYFSELKLHFCICGQEWLITVLCLHDSQYMSQGNWYVGKNESTGTGLGRTHMLVPFSWESTARKKYVASQSTLSHIDKYIYMCKITAGLI